MSAWGGDSTRTPELSEVILNALNAHDQDFRVALVASVQSYDASKQRVSVQPLTQRPFVDDSGTEGIEQRPVISNVPVAFPRGGGMMITFPIQQGDTGLLVFSDQSLDIWKQQGGNVDPIDLRLHHISDAVFFPGVAANPNVLQSADISVVALGQDGASADFVALASKVLDQLNSIASTFNAHTHIISGTTASPGSPIVAVNAPPASSMNPDSVASDTVKILG